jgi:hypothetical protein
VNELRACRSEIPTVPTVRRWRNWSIADSPDLDLFRLLNPNHKNDLFCS